MPLSLRRALCALQLDTSSRSNLQPNPYVRRNRFHRHPKMLQDDNFENQVDAMPRRQRHDHGDVIVISDDEDEVEIMPLYVRRRSTRPPSSHSTRSELSAGFDENDRDIPVRTRHHVSKRRKVERDDSDAPNNSSSRKPLLTDHEDGYTKANLSFSPNGSRANLLFRTGEHVQDRPPMSPLSDCNDFVQGSLHDPFDKNAAAPPQIDICPYYYDQVLDVKMYRGPGYERFPVCLGTVKGHKEICDKWDARRKEAHDEDQLYIASLTGGVNPVTITKTQRAIKLERQCLREVQEVFPQIQTKFVLDKYLSRVASNEALQNDVAQLATEIISEIAELDTYPREEASERAEEILVLPEDGTGVTIVYDKSIAKDEPYRKEALRMLAAEFTHIPTIAINRVLEVKQSLFDTFSHFRQCEATYFELPRDQKPYTRSRQPRIMLEKKYQRGLDEPTNSRLYQTLVNELQAAKQHGARELYRLKKDRDAEAEEAANLLQHKLEGSLIECQVCFDEEIPMNRAVMCEGDVGHFFCFSCVARLAESQIGAMKHEMMCMDGSGCKAVLSLDGVGRAVPTKVVDKLAFYQQQAEISAAGIEGLEQCPYCEYKAICDPVEEDCIFMCQNPDCGKNTCRKCNEASHLPKSCEEAKKDKGLSARHLVEEARSEAMMRKCPKCKAKIIKEHGCNKMMCSCGNQMCYVCQQDISGQTKDAGYQHFHRAGAKCPLYDAQGTERHDADADAAEKEAIKQVKAQEGNEDLDDKDLQIETGKEKAKKGSKNQEAYVPPARVDANHYPDFADIRHLAQFQPGNYRPFVMPPAFGDAPRARMARGARHELQAQRHAVIQEQIQQLRARAEDIQRRRVALQNQQMDHVHQVAQDAQQAARDAQERVNRIMEARFAGYGGQDVPLDFFNQPVPGQVNLPFMHYPYQPNPQLPLQAMPRMPNVNLELPENIDEMDFLFDGPRQQMQANHRNLRRNRNRNAAAPEELDHPDFARWVLGDEMR
jgi:hypothetical protein